MESISRETDFVFDSSEMPEQELKNNLLEIEYDLLIVSKENSVYKYIWKENSNEAEKINTIKESATEASLDLLLSSEKCYLAKKYLAELKESLLNKNTCSSKELKDLKLKQDFLNENLNNLKRIFENFDKQVIEKHPVTNKIILQKIINFFYDSIRHKNITVNRCKLQIKSFTLECNKLLNQIKDEENRLASLDPTGYQEMKYKYQSTCEELKQSKENFALCKSKYSALLLNAAEMEKTFKEQQYKLTGLSKDVSRKSHVKNLTLSRRTFNMQKTKELNEAMQKIKSDPRRHNLPDVPDYIAVKRENENLKLSITFWKKKVAVAKQARLIRLNTKKM